MNYHRLTRRKLHGQTQGNYEHELGVLGIMKDEAMNIDEWVQHYISMGAGKIFLIDNGSTDDTVAKAKAWVAQGIVELVEYPQRYRQKQHYWSAIKEMKIAKRCQWLLIADLDEFWFCPSGETIAAQLPDFYHSDVIYANWRMFGSSGLDKHPQSLRQGFTQCTPWRYAEGGRKYLCRTSVLKTQKTLKTHRVVGACSSRTVSENERFHLNHYAIQSVEYFQKVKMTRGDVSSINAEMVRDMGYFHKIDAPCTTHDHLLADLVASGRIK
ncbi:MAG: hypothetical protein CFE33_11860 [Pseudorhodobacter sp. PARRP1]|nr:MAG: hypothetical protein CFE33_11860 [Pseudorhodobacter sp. PARRP1]